MGTECNAGQLTFAGLGRRSVVGAFDGGEIASDGGALALRELECRTGILRRLSGCFVDHRNPLLAEHAVETLVKQRVYGICLGYEDLNDHDALRRDRLMALLCDCADVVGAGRRRAADRGMPLAGKSTLNRLELSVLERAPEDRHKGPQASTVGPRVQARGRQHARHARRHRQQNELGAEVQQGTRHGGGGLRSPDHPGPY